MCSYSISHPKAVCTIAALAILAIAPGALRLELRTDGHALAPANDPEVAIEREIRNRFGIEDPIVVLIDSDDDRGVFNPLTLCLVQELTEAFKELDGVNPWNVVSLLTEKSDRVRPGTLSFRTLLEPFPETDDDLDRLRDDVRAIELYTGTLVSFDEGATAVFVGVPDGADRIDLYSTITEIVRQYEPAADRIHIIGAPVAEALLGTHILEDLGVPSMVLGHSLERGEPKTAIGEAGWTSLPASLARRVGMVPLAMTIIAVVFWLAFRGFVAVMLPLMEVGACLTLVFGLMGWCGVPFYLTMAVMPVILTVIGIADEVHIFHRYRRECRSTTGQSQPGAQATEPSHEPVRRTMEQMWIPVTKTSITTALCFLSFTLSPIEPVQMFGLFTAVGILICMVWSLSVIPASLVLCQRRSKRTSKINNSDNGPDTAANRMSNENQETGSPLLARATRAVLARPITVLLLSLLVIATTPYGLRKLVVQDSWIDGFAPTSEFHKATNLFNDRFLGVHTLHIHMDAGHFACRGHVDPHDVEHHELKLPAGIVDNPRTLLGSTLRIFPEHGEDDRSVAGRRMRRLPDWIATIENVDVSSDRWIVSTPNRAGSLKLAMRRWTGKSVSYEITPLWFKQPEFLKKVRSFETFLRSQTGGMVGGVLGPVDYVETANFMQSGRRQGSRSIPINGANVARTWHNFERIRGTERTRQVVDSEFASGLISVFLKNANYVETAALMNRIRDYEAEHLSPQGITVNFSGDVAVSQSLIDGIVTTQVRSLTISLCGIWLITSILNRSLIWGFFCVVPSALAVLMNFALMGWLDIPVGVATSMFAGITLGIGVDYAIHLLERIRQAIARGLQSATAITEAVTSTGPAIAIDALAVGLGFGVMFLSQVPANVRLGGLLVASIVSCLAATLLLLPAIVFLTTEKHD